MSESPRPHIVVIAADTLRPAYLGCYGNGAVHTPNIDRLAAQSIRFTRAHPEALPTIPTRRTVHGGRRVYPFADYRPVPWDNVYLPGWQPLARDEPTVAEALDAAGYHTGFVADVPHYFVPGMNFTRGFRQWQFVRGQAEDRLGAESAADPALLARYHGNSARHLVNVRPQAPEEQWPTARTFRWAQQFLEQNVAGGKPLYLYVDSFTPHETWEAPLHYYDLYGSRDDREPVWLSVPYGPLADTPELAARLPSVRANYAGLVTMVDHWCGRLLDTIDRLGIADRTLVLFFSDHGTNFADNPEGIVGKPAGWMYPGTMEIPLLLRLPDGRGAGTECDRLASTTDIPATVADTAGLTGLPLDGTSLRTAADGTYDGGDYLTCRYGNHLWYRDDRTWFFSNLDFAGVRLFDLEADPRCRNNVAKRLPERAAAARDRILADAGGRLIRHDPPAATDAIGRRPT